MLKSVAVILLVLFVFPLHAQPISDPNSTTLFTVNGKDVAAEEFIYIYRKNHRQTPEEFTQEKIEEYLDLFIRFKLKVEEARNRGMDTTSAFRKEYGRYRDELRRPYLPDGRILDSLTRLTYERMREEIRASHILVMLKPDASPADTLEAYNRIIDLRKRALAGENFNDLARTYSEDPSAKSNGGDLGYFSALQMVYPFENAAYATPPGEISAPVRTRFGYHLVKVTDRRPAQGEVEVSHILLRTDNGADDGKARNTIFEIYDQLQQGVNWEELCRQYSQDVATRDKGGRLRPFRSGMLQGVPEFEEIAFGLEKPGDISDPFQTRFGWHIIRLESKIPLPSFEEMAPSLRGRISHDERMQLSKQVAQKETRKKLGFIENKEPKQKLTTLADSTLTAGQWNISSNAIDGNAVLFHMKGNAFRVRDFLQYVQKHQKAVARSPQQYLEQLYEAYVSSVEDELLDNLIMAESPDYRWLLREYYEGVLLFEIMDQEVWKKAADDSAGQHRFYMANVQKYQAGERIEGRIFSSPSSENIRDLHNMLQRGDTLRLPSFIAERNIRREDGVFERHDRPVLGKIRPALGLRTVENGDLYYLVEIRRILPPGHRTFAEARAAVISDYQNYLEEKWVQELRKKYKVRVLKKGKKTVFRQLLLEA